jgi:hypothetical protein
MAPFWRENQLVQTPKRVGEKNLKRELMIWRTKMQTRVQGRVELNDSIYLK